METIKRNTSQSYDANATRGEGSQMHSSAMNTGPIGGSLGNLQELSQNQSSDLGSDAMNKKPRFVSEGQLPMMNVSIGHDSRSTNTPYGYGQPSHMGHMSQNNTAAMSPQGAVPHPSYPPQTSSNERPFSGPMMNHSGGMVVGIPGSSYTNHQYGTVHNASGNQQPGHFHQGPPMPPYVNTQSSMGAPMYSPTYSSAPIQGGMGINNFMPNVLMAMPQLGKFTGRTVYVGNLPAEASVDEMLNQVKFGPIENIKILPEKNCAFISFLDGAMAAAFHADASVKKMSLHNQELKIGWGKPSACPTPILMAVQQHQATRNVYLGQLEEDVTEQSLRDDLARFGPIDQVKIVRDKNIGFVHFLSISTAMKVVSMLPNEPAWAGKRVNYGKDRCAYIPKSQQQNQAHNNQAAAMGMAAAASLGYPTAYPPSGPHYQNFGSNSNNSGPSGNPPGVYSNSNQMEDTPSGQPSTPTAPNVYGALGGAAANMAAMQQMGNRTVYLGNIHPDTSTEEICNHIRGGILQTIRLIPEKHIAFITFVDSNAALAFYHLANFQGIMIHQRRLKIGWGKHSGPLSPALAMAVQSGGSRNVYVGNIEDFDIHTVDKLRNDFIQYGDVELVNTLKEKNCAFINFCNIQNAIKAIEAMKNHPDYKNQRVGAGKDRCGNRECQYPLLCDDDVRD